MPDSHINNDINIFISATVGTQYIAVIVKLYVTDQGD